jgi:tetratricopeptide (TPR) repeat protein
MSTSAIPNDGDGIESRDSAFFEFIDPVFDFTARPVREETLRHAPSWLRERSPGDGPKPGGPAALAAGLLARARVLQELKQYAEAVTASAEAQRLYESAGMTAALADCFHLSAQLHQALGRPDEALDFLRREAELRRRMSA